jgi:hypothetical protein
MTAVNWMPKKYKSKYSNPNSTDILISTQHIEYDFYAQYLKKNILVNKYSFILKSITT